MAPKLDECARSLALSVIGGLVDIVDLAWFGRAGIFPPALFADAAVIYGGMGAYISPGPGVAARLEP